MVKVVHDGVTKDQYYRRKDVDDFTVAADDFRCVLGELNGP